MSDRLVNVHLPGDNYPIYSYCIVPAEEVAAIRELAESKDLRCSDHVLTTPDKLISLLESLT